MRRLLLACAALFAVSSCARAILCPVFFYVTDVSERANQLADYGTYVLRNGTQFPGPFYYHPTGEEEEENLWPCSTHVTVYTDDPVGLYDRIEEWVSYECARLQKPRAECVVVAYTQENSIRSRYQQQQTTQRPTMTAQPTIPNRCEDRTRELECAHGCHWFGALIGCRDVGFCDLPTRTSCLARRQYCKWSLHDGCVAIPPASF